MKNMKKIAVVTNQCNSPLGIFLKKNLETVFANYVTVNIYSFAELKPGEMIVPEMQLRLASGTVVNPKL